MGSGIRTCSPESYGLSGQWMNNGDFYEWDDHLCGRLRAFDPLTFCKSQLQCGNVLIVGDSTSNQFAHVLAGSLQNHPSYSHRRENLQILFDYNKFQRRKTYLPHNEVEQEHRRYE